MLNLTHGHVKHGSGLYGGWFRPIVGSDTVSTVAEVYDQVLSFLRDPDSGDFDDLALRVFRHQFERCKPYRAYCESRGMVSGEVQVWMDIPPVPIQAFKVAELCCGIPERVFLSTGTTEGVGHRSRHCMPALRLYRASAIAGLRNFLFPDVERMDLVSLIPPVAGAPESSLAQMVAWAAEEFGHGTMVEAAADEAGSFDLLIDSVRRSERDGAPLAILTTTGALIRFLDFARARSLIFRLPHGSRLMDTGGGKGSPRQVSRRGILHAVWATFAIPGYFSVNEYGMAELSSQYYDSVIRDRFDGIHRPRVLLSPPWLRALVLNPETLRPLEKGCTGLICHFDLANAGSAMAVLSEDMGRMEDDGLHLTGRAPRAEARGCSLTAAEWPFA